MRISKEPEARKQEILETAMKLFAEKGYEKTSISDIAKEIGVAQGLCYRYFPSKDILFQTAVNEYANILVDKLKTNINIEQDSIKDILNHMEVLSESTNDTYYDTFHDEKNKTFHDLLSLSICKKLVPVVVKLIKKANVTGELNISDVDFKNNGIRVLRKGGNEMVVYFGLEVEAALKDYLELSRNKITPLSGHENALFLSGQRKRISVDAIEKMVKKYSSAISVKTITPHKLRSTYGTALYRETGDIYLVADVLGHSDVNTTKKHYARLSDDRRRAASKAVILREKPDSHNS